MLVEYIRDLHGHPYGVVVATSSSRIHFAVCDTSVVSFNKKRGIDIALGRISKRVPIDARLPKGHADREVCPPGELREIQLSTFIKARVEKMRERATRYFKDAIAV